MVRIVCNSYKFYNGMRLLQEPNKRYVTFEFDVTTDKDIMKQIYEILNRQPLCANCINYESGGYFCGYESHFCTVHGNIEYFNHPHHDMDGSKCESYKRKENINESLDS